MISGLVKENCSHTCWFKCDGNLLHQSTVWYLYLCNWDCNARPSSWCRAYCQMVQ